MELQKYEQEHLDILRPLLPECTVLLKKNGDFPLGKPGKIALYGNGVRKTVKGGTGSGEVNSRFFEIVEDGFQKAGFELFPETGLMPMTKYMTKRRLVLQKKSEEGRRSIIHIP